MKRLLATLASAFLLLTSSTASMAGSVLAPGEPAPALEVSGPSGQMIALAALKGHPVLVDFWASWCPPCRTSIPALDAIYREFHSQGLEVLAVNVDERRKDADLFLAGREYLMPIVFDSTGASPRAVGVYGMPTSFLVDRAGIIRFVHRGYSDKVQESYRREIRQLLAE